MGLFSNVDESKTSNLTIKDPRELYKAFLKGTSGAGLARDLKYNIFYQIFAFKGIKEGVGTSTLVANTAVAIADLGLSVLVIDTSILQPTQDTLLHTNLDNYDEDKIKDWFELPYTRQSVLHQSRINSNVSVLSFFRRNVIDCLSTNDNSSLVDLALTMFHNKFDIILIDCCHELTSINTSALQMSQQVIQVWNDQPTVLANLDMFITNCVTLSCPMDKMRNVVFSKISREAMGSMDVLLKQYRFKKLTSFVNSESCSLVCTLDRILWQYASKDKDIIEYTNSIIDIVGLILNIAELDGKAKGTITSNDIIDGKVEGTLSKKFVDASLLEEKEEEDNADIDRSV